MYFQNLFGKQNPGALTQTPDNTLASLLAQRSGGMAQQPMGGPQIPAIGQGRTPMGAPGIPNLSPATGAVGPGTATPQQSNPLGQFAGMDQTKVRELLQQLGLGGMMGGAVGGMDAANGGSNGSDLGIGGPSRNQPLIGDLGNWLGLDRIFGR